MSTMPSRTPDQQAPPPPADRLSVTQIVASLLATVTATSALSLFGVAGTLIGAGLASVLTVVGNHVYTESIKRTRAQVLARAAALRARGESPDADSPADFPADSAADRAQPPPPATARRTLDLGSRKRLLFSILGVFVAILAAITVFELAVGRTVSQVVRDEPGKGTSLGGYTDSPTSTKSSSSSSSDSSTSPTSSSTSSTTSSTTPVQTTATSSSTTGSASSSSTSATTSPTASVTSTGASPTSHTPAPTTTGGG